MSHKPPLPDAATSPFPLHPAPIEHSDPVETASGETESGGTLSSKASEAIDAITTKVGGRTLGIAAGAAAIGSVAVAAALLFYNRPATPAKRPATKPKPRPKRTAKATVKPAAKIAAAPKPTPASKPASSTKIKSTTAKSEAPKSGTRSKAKSKPGSST